MLVAFILVGGFIILTNWSTFAPNWDPFIPEPTGKQGEFGWSGILRAASIVFFAYIGFEAVSTAAQEAKNPAKDMPFGIIGSLVACTMIYILVSIVLTLIVDYRQLNVPDPVAVAVDAFGPQWAWFATTIKIGAIIGLTSVILVLMYGQTRIFYTMARDGLLPRVFSRVHPKFRTPWINTLVVGLAVAIAGGFFDINFLGDATSVGTLAAFAIVCLTVIWLRRTHPEIPRGYRVPLLSGRSGSRHRVLRLADHLGAGERADLLRLVRARRGRPLLRLRHAQFRARQGPRRHGRRRDALFPGGRAARRRRQAGDPAVGASWRARTPRLSRLEGLDHVVLLVDDMAEAARFYREVIGCTVENALPQYGMLQLRAGAALIDLVDIGVERRRLGAGRRVAGRPQHGPCLHRHRPLGRSGDARPPRRARRRDRRGRDPRRRPRRRPVLLRQGPVRQRSSS